MYRTSLGTVHTHRPLSGPPAQCSGSRSSSSTSSYSWAGVAIAWVTADSRCVKTCFTHGPHSMVHLQSTRQRVASIRLGVEGAIMHAHMMKQEVSCDMQDDVQQGAVGEKGRTGVGGGFEGRYCSGRALKRRRGKEVGGCGHAWCAPERQSLGAAGPEQPEPCLHGWPCQLPRT